MITVTIDEEKAIDMLVERLHYWTDDEDIISLYEKMYNNYVYGGCFDGAEFDVMAIVDNDYVNYCGTIGDDDERFAELLKIYREQGCGDCSCETDICAYIEAVDNEDEPTIFLVRY